MSSIYAKGKRLYFSLKVNGEWTNIRTEFKTGQERQAQAMLDRIDAREAAGEALDVGGPPTVASWLPAWLKTRKAHVQTWKNDESVMRLHVLPLLGHLRLDEVRPKHLVDLVRSWRARTDDEAMAPKSVWNGYSSLSAFFRDAALEDLIAATPCVLTKHQLGPKVDADPEWRATAKYSRAELEQLVSDARIPMDRRVFYALEGVGGLRLGEAAGQLWRNTLTPVPEYPGSLDMMLVAYSYERAYPKGDVCRPVPVHPALAGLLAEWKLSGWERFMGRKPTADDLVVPLPPDAVSKKGRWRRKAWVRKWFARDLEALGLRHRRGHDLRRTCISLARSAGAQKEIHKRTTHKPPREVIEGYTTFEWPVVCTEVLKLPVQRHQTGKVLSMPIALAVNDSAPRSALDETKGRPTVLPTFGGFSEGKRQWRSPDSNRAEASPDQHGSGPTTSSAPGDSGVYGEGQVQETPDQREPSDAAGRKVGNALAEALADWRRDGDDAALARRLRAVLALLGGAT